MFIAPWVPEGKPTPDPEPLERTEDKGLAHLVSSRIVSPRVLESDDLHMPVLDIDLPTESVQVLRSPSGNSHLYINKAMTWPQMERLLDAMEYAGLLQTRYVAACKAQRMTRVRLPGVPKPPYGAQSGGGLPEVGGESEVPF